MGPAWVVAHEPASTSSPCPTQPARGVILQAAEKYRLAGGRFPVSGAQVSRRFLKGKDFLVVGYPALSGKVSSDLQVVIRKRPRLFSQLLRELRDAPDHAILRVVREVRGRAVADL